MKKIITICLLLSIYMSYGQKVKVKKGNLLFDGVPIMKVDSKARNYTYTNLTGNASIIVTLESVGEGEIKEDWLIVKDPASNRTKRIKMEWFGISMNFKKGIAELLAKKYDIITDNGIGNLDEFYGSSSSSNDLNKVVNIDNYTINDNSVLEKTNNSIVMSFVPAIGSNSYVEQYDVLDLKGEKFAKLFKDEENYFLITFDDRSKQHNLGGNTEKSVCERLLIVLLQNGYKDVLDKGMDERMNKALASLAEKIKNTKNIYKQKGYIIDKDGKKISGSVSIFFESYYDPRSKIEYENEKKGANFIRVHFIDGNGEEAYKSIEQKEAVAYLVNEGKPHTKYMRFKTQRTKTLNSDTSLRNLLNSSKYYEVIYEGDMITVFKNPMNENQYGFQKRGDKKSKLLVNNNIRNYNILVDYLKCKLPSEFKDLNFKDKSDLMKIVEYYTNSCSK